VNQSLHPLLRILSRAVPALLASGLVLAGVYLVYLESHLPGGTSGVQPREIAGRDLQAVMGSARVEGDNLVITGYERQASGSLAVATWRGRLHADDYPWLTLRVDAGYPRPILKFVWRIASDQLPHGVDLPRNTRGSVRVDLVRNPDWRGEITEVGIFVRTMDPAPDVTISHLSLEPLSAGGIMEGHWLDWTAPRGWTQLSINQLYGTSDPRALSPVLVAALWSGLALLLLWVTALLFGSGHRGAVVAVVLIPWVSVDLLWQNELGAQLARTREQFAGKTRHEKHLADIDGPVYRYIRRLKEDVLPPEPARIILLHQQREGHNYERLKAQYYLLPHNVYNFDNELPPGDLQGVDYILTLGASPFTRYRERERELVSRGGNRVSAALVDEDSLGSLYRVLPDPSNTGSAR